MNRSPGVTSFSVTKTTDTHDGVCDADCSLREAIAAANANAGSDEGPIPAGTYPLTPGWLPIITDDRVLSTATVVFAEGCLDPLTPRFSSAERTASHA